MAIKKCLHCDSTNMVRGLQVHAEDKHSSEIKLSVDGTYSSFLRTPASATAKANACADCGFVMFFAAKSEIKALLKK